MSAIRESLLKLDGAINNLEGSMGGLENSLAARQHDMFANMPSNENGEPVTPKEVSMKLDLAIKKVEEILKDGTNG